MRRKIIATCTLLPFTTVSVFSALEFPSDVSCSYAGKLQQCISANNSHSARSIKDFVCIDSQDWQKILFQIILDEKFKEIDEEIEEYMEKLEESKWEYFWDTANKSFLAAVDDINSNFPENGHYWGRYKQICYSGVLEEAGKCTDSIKNTEVSKYILWNTWAACLSLIKTKLSVYEQISYDVLKLNKVKVRKDERKKFVQQERTKYNALLDMMRDIIGYIERMANGWVTKTPNPK